MTDRHLRAVPAAWDDLEAQAEAMDWVCPYCAAPAGDTCRNRQTGDDMRASHWQRITAAKSGHDLDE